jgi:hypothetical protein
MRAAIKIVVCIFLLAITYLVFSVTLSSIVKYYQLNNSARSVLKDIVGIEHFNTHQAYVHSWFLNTGGRWHLILDAELDLSKTTLPSELMKVTERSDIPAPDEYIHRLFHVNFVGYVCYSGFDLKLGPDSICSSNSPSVCNVTVCAKQGDKNIFITVTPF